jgi:hypothetical protein
MPQTGAPKTAALHTEFSRAAFEASPTDALMVLDCKSPMFTGLADRAVAVDPEGVVRELKALAAPKLWASIKNPAAFMKTKLETIVKRAEANRKQRTEQPEGARA